MTVNRKTNINKARKLADELSERVAQMTFELGLTYEQLEQSAAEEIRNYRIERRRSNQYSPGQRDTGILGKGGIDESDDISTQK